MKNFLLILILLTLFGCKNDSKKDNTKNKSDSFSEENIDSLRVSDRNLELTEQTFDLKRRELIEKKDQKAELESLVISKSFLKVDDGYTMDFKYPYLNEKIKPSYENFNEYITKYYLDAEGVEKQILEEKRLCDSLGIPQEHEKRIVEYKIYNLNDRLLSVLFYKENHYTGAAHAAYTFETLNFDLDRSVFMNYDDFFIEGTEEELREILNNLLTDKINSGEMYYDCWTISEDDFFEAKNNFVVNDDEVEYYFDDCVICPSYTGTYSIKIPLQELMPVLKKFKKNPLIL
ncbi:MAG: RsiV family protein [Aequorivita sp.]